MTKEKFVVGSNDADEYWNLKVSSLFMYFQDVATTGVQNLKLDGSILRGKYNVDWIITNMECEIYRMPKYHEEITICTYAGQDMMGLFFPRFFFVLDKKKNIIAKCASVWALLDIDTRKLSQNRDIVKGLKVEHRDDELPVPKKLTIGDVKFFDRRKIYYSETDVNGHLNNCSYVKLVVDTNNKEFYKDYEISKVSLCFLKEIKEGDEIEIFKADNGSGEIAFKRGDDLCFTSKVEYRKR